MKTSTTFRCTNSDFVVLEMKGREFLIESTQRTLVNVGEPLEFFQRDSRTQSIIESIHNELFALTKNVSDHGSSWEVFAWMGEFSSVMSSDGGYQITYSVRYTGSVINTHLLEIDKQVAEIRETAEAILRANFNRITEKTGKESYVF